MKVYRITHKSLEYESIAMTLQEAMDSVGESDASLWTKEGDSTDNPNWTLNFWVIEEWEAAEN